MPRLRNPSTAVNVENAHTSQHAKRLALENIQNGNDIAEQPMRKRAALGDLTNAVQRLNNFQLDSSKKPAIEKAVAEIAPKRSIRTRQLTNAALDVPLASMESEEFVVSSSPASSLPTARRQTRQSAARSLTLLRSVSPVSIDDPAPETDFDAECLGDIFSVPHYVMDIFRYSRWREQQFVVDDYLARNPSTDITLAMRATLVDWMVEIQENFELNHETLYQAVKMTDMYLNRRLDAVNKERLQLVGAAALFITTKFDERQPPLADDFIYVCDDAYTREELMEMEREMLKVLDFDIGMPLSYSYLRRYAKATRSTMEVLNLARYILEMSLMHYEFVSARESRLAAASLALASRMMYPALTSPTEIWSRVHEKYSDMKYAEFASLIPALNKMLHNRNMHVNGSPLTTILNKYSHDVFLGVAVKYAPLPLSTQ